MRKTIILASVLVGLTATAQTDPAYNHRVGINTATPRASLEVKATTFDQRTQGILFPHISNEEKKKWQPNETTGLMAGTVIWNENLKCLDYFDGEKWQCTDGSNPYYPPVNTTKDKNVKADVWDRYHYIGSFNHSGANIDGVLDNATNKLTLQIPYNQATLNGEYNAINVKRTVKDRNGKNVLLTLHIPKGKFTQAKGFLEGTIIVGSGATTDTFSVKQLDANREEILATFSFSINGNASDVNLIASGGLLDKMFNKETNNKLEHQFIYIPVSAYTDKVDFLPDSGPHYEKKWLNNNLGAYYAKVGNNQHTKQATAHNDHNAYGYFFQWQRKPDGHEVVTWTNATTPNTFSPAVTSPLGGSDWTVNHTNFIWDNEPSLSWVDDATTNSASNKDLWQAGKPNNPCPTGFHVPTYNEWDLFHTSMGGSQGYSYWSTKNALRFSMTGGRVSKSNYEYGTHFWRQGMVAGYHSSSVSKVFDPLSTFFDISESGSETVNSGASGSGVPVRCIVD